MCVCVFVWRGGEGGGVDYSNESYSVKFKTYNRHGCHSGVSVSRKIYDSGRSEIVF